MRSVRPRKTRRRRRVLLATAVAAGALVAAGSVALAALPGLERITESGVFDSATSKNVGTGCPTGKKLLGIGGRIRAESGPTSWIGTLQSGRVALTRLVPTPSLSAVSVTGVEISSNHVSNWAVQSYGLCETETATHELQHVQKTSVSDSSSKKIVEAACPFGKRVVGAGGSIGTPAATGGRVILTRIAPNVLLNGVTAIGEELPGGTAANWQVSAFAVCAAEANVPGLEYKSAATAIDSQAHKYTYVDCPAGKKVVGAAGGVGLAETGRVVLTGIAVHGGPTPRVSAYGAEQGKGTTGTWNVTAIAICATP